MSPALRDARRRAGLALVVLVAAACAPPRARQLPGAPAAPVAVPRGELPPTPRRVVFRWTYTERGFQLTGDGVARVQPPDSARLDVFLGGGFGGGTAFLIGDSVIVGGGPMMQRVLPAPPLLWAAFGRLDVPPARDTIVRVDGDTLRADIGSGPTWRVTFVGQALVRLQRIADGHVLETVTRDRETHIIRYDDAASHRQLVLAVTSSSDVPPFDASIWPH